MSVGAIGNVVLVNQMTPAVTPVQGNQYTRFDLQNIAAQAAVQEKEKEIEELRPTEENHAIDPDREHQREEADEETGNLPKKKNHKIHEEENTEEQEIPLHLLDIKV
ncbi:hypothetical protein [Sulfurimonas sp.]